MDISHSTGRATSSTPGANRASTQQGASNAAQASRSPPPHARLASPARANAGARAPEGIRRRPLGEFHAAAIAHSSTYAAMAREALQAGPVDDRPIPAARRQARTRLGLLIEIAKASAVDRLSELDRGIDEGAFEEAARTTALSLLESALARHPGDRAAAIYARETERVKFDHLKRIARALEEFHAAGQLDADEPVARAVRAAAAGTFEDFFTEQIRLGRAQQHLEQYDRAWEVAASA